MSKERLKIAKYILIIVALAYQLFSLEDNFNNYSKCFEYIIFSSTIFSFWLFIEISLDKILLRKHFIFSFLLNDEIFIERLKYIFLKKN